jgi:hypothetical protein
MPLQLRPDVATTDTDDGMVLLDERTGRYWQLNITGARVLRQLSEGRLPERIAGELASHYCIDLQRAHQDVVAVTDHLRLAGLLDNPDGPTEEIS